MLELVRVAKVYGVKVVFKDISCAFAAGSVSLLVGGNGAGKSTLMRIMAGLSRPSAGAAKVADQARVGYLGHATFLYPGLTAVENLAFWREAYGLKLTRDDIMAGLARVGLEAHAHERAGVFSRGMAQALIWRGCSCRPPMCSCWTNPARALMWPRWPCCGAR